jgi:hypothetical protein
MFRKGELISKSVLTAHIYDEDFDRDSNVIEVFIGRLRKNSIDGTRKPIETLRTGRIPVDQAEAILSSGRAMAGYDAQGGFLALTSRQIALRAR